MSDQDESRFLGLHAAYEATHPDGAAIEREYQRQRTSRGLTASREFPCPGALREYDRTTTLIYAVCDACAFETSFDRDDRPTRARALEDA